MDGALWWLGVLILAATVLAASYWQLRQRLQDRPFSVNLGRVASHLPVALGKGLCYGALGYLGMVVTGLLFGILALVLLGVFFSEVPDLLRDASTWPW